MRQFTHFSLAAAALLLAGQAQAVSLNVTAAADYWNPSPSGFIQGQSSQPEVDLKDELGLSREGATHLAIQFEHFIPWVPNLRIRQTNLDLSGSKAADFEFRDSSFAGQVESDLDLSHTDVTGYYRFLDGVTSLLPLVSLRAEAGLTLRFFDGGVDLADAQGNEESIDLNTALPLGYLGGRVDLPGGVALGAEANYVSYQGNTVSDINWSARYEYRDWGLLTPGVQVGYRSLNLDLDDLDEVYGDLTLKGPHLGVYLRAGF